MDNVKDINTVQDAAADLQRVLKVKMDDGLQTMKAVQERVQEYNVYSNAFTNRTYEHLRTSIQTQVGTFHFMFQPYFDGF
jgi:exocyst complex component 1